MNEDPNLSMTPAGTSLGAFGLRPKQLIIVAVVVLSVGLALWVILSHPRGSAGSSARARSEINRSVPVRAVEAVTGNVDLTVDALGTVTAFNTVTIHSRVDGPLVDVPFHEGQWVKSGDLLAQIDPRTFESALGQAKGQQARDQAQLAGARVDLDRYRGLLQKDSIAGQQVDAQQYTVRQLEGAVEADRAAVEAARLQLEFTRITAPFAGRVGLRQVDPGNIVHASDANGLAVLTQTRPIYVIFAVPSEHLPEIYARWHRGESLVAEAMDRDGKRLAQGTLEAMDNQIDVTTGTIKLKAKFPNQDDVLFPSQFVNVRLKIDTLPNATLIPSAAVQRGAPGTFVYVVDGEGKVALRKTALGPTSGDLVAVSSGVAPGESVVVDGLDKLRDGATVTVIENAAEPASGDPQTGRHKHNGSHDGSRARS